MIRLKCIKWSMVLLMLGLFSWLAPEETSANPLPRPLSWYNSVKMRFSIKGLVHYSGVSSDGKSTVRNDTSFVELPALNGDPFMKGYSYSVSDTLINIHYEVSTWEYTATDFKFRIDTSTSQVLFFQGTYDYKMMDLKIDQARNRLIKLQGMLAESIEDSLKVSIKGTELSKYLLAVVYHDYMAQRYEGTSTRDFQAYLPSPDASVEVTFYHVNNPYASVALETTHNYEDVDIYPNPCFNGALNISHISSDKGLSHIVIQNSIGIIVYSKEVLKSASTEKVVVPVGSLQPGVYYLTVQNSLGNFTRPAIRRFVVAR